MSSNHGKQSAVDFAERVRENQRRLRSNLKSQYDFIVCGSGPEYLRYPDGRQQLIYANENEYPAEDVLSFLRRELKKRGWKPLTQDFFNPEKPSSERSGWEFMEDQTQKPSKATWQWSAEWENGSQDITMYFLRYESPTNSPLDAKNLQVTALYIPAEIAAKMKRDGEKFKQDRNPKL